MKSELRLFCLIAALTVSFCGCATQNAPGESGSEALTAQETPATAPAHTPESSASAGDTRADPAPEGGGQSPGDGEDDYTSGTGTVVMNNGGLYVSYGGAVYYRQYSAEGFEESGLWDNFSPVPGAKSHIVRLNPDGTRDVLFEDHGLGPIFIHQGGASGAQFILTGLTENEEGDRLRETYVVDFHDCKVGFGMPGEAFALDEERSLLLVRAPHSGIFALDLTTHDVRQLAGVGWDPICYDEEDGVLYCSPASDGDTVAIAAIRPDGGEALVLYSETRQAISAQMADDGYAGQFLEFQNAVTDDGHFYVNLVWYDGTGHYFCGMVRLKLGKDGSAYEYLGEIAEPDWFGTLRPFSYRTDGPFYRDADGYCLFERPDAGVARLLLSREDLAAAGLPEGEYFGEEDFASLKDIEFVDEAVFFTVMTGTRNADEDIGWRTGYDRGPASVMRKDMITGRVSVLYTY